ncbi:hypothetical protein LIER_36871 [Lithospermum erythrorhizon]|uniref:Reverse transcriptase n=1 Tax=Lithospermum erythrorhizon TaxID=34254 RepID=A0AAV3PBZ6_LITER
MSCVTNCWFSTVENGHLQGYFRSEQGVRQGDPLAPSLFILAQEYLIRGLDLLYQKWPAASNYWSSGQQRESHEVSDLEHAFYLSWSSGQQRRKKTFIYYLIAKVSSNDQGWNHKSLSYSGRMVLIQSVLQALPMYYMQSLELPIGVTQRLQKIFNQFLWGSTTDAKHIHWCSWQKACLPFDEGGLILQEDMITWPCIY